MPTIQIEHVKKVTHHFLATFILCAIFAGIVIFGLVSYSLVFNENVHEDTPMTADHANAIGCPITIPETATKIRFDNVHRWFEHIMFIRFDADSDICHEHINTVMAQYAPRTTSGKDSSLKVERITQPQKVDSWGSLGSLSWFNIGRITDGVVATESSGTVIIWIDDQRGIFYCKINH